MQLRSDNFQHGKPIPSEFAFAKPGKPVALSDNHNPHLAWKDAPAGTRSFVLTCIDTDVPSKPDDVNKEGRSVPADLPRDGLTSLRDQGMPVKVILGGEASRAYEAARFHR